MNYRKIIKIKLKSELFKYFYLLIYNNYIIYINNQTNILIIYIYIIFFLSYLYIHWWRILAVPFPASLNASILYNNSTYIYIYITYALAKGSSVEPMNYDNVKLNIFYINKVWKYNKIFIRPILISFIFKQLTWLKKFYLTIHI